MGFGLIVALAFPALSDPDNAGRSEKHLRINFPFLKNEHAKQVLVYFGYVGCTRVCTPALNDLASIYREHKQQTLKNDTSIYFVNMTPQMDAASVQSWSEHFDRDFKSYAPTQAELRRMVQTLNLVYTELGVEAEHMPYAYLIQKKSDGYELLYIYTSSPYNRTLMLKDLERTE